MEKMLLRNDLYHDDHALTFGQSFLSGVAREVDQREPGLVCDRFLSECAAIILHHIDDPLFGVVALSRELGMSHSALYKKIKAIAGKSANELVRLVRLKYAAELLIHSAFNVNEVAFHAGFNDVKYFRKQFKHVYDLTPSAYRKRYHVDQWDTARLQRKDMRCSIVWTAVRSRPDSHLLPICPP